MAFRAMPDPYEVCNVILAHSQSPAAQLQALHTIQVRTGAARRLMLLPPLSHDCYSETIAPCAALCKHGSGNFASKAPLHAPDGLC